MKNGKSLAWALLVLGIVSIVAGVYRTGASGEISLLLITGMGATTVGMVLHDGLTDGAAEGANSEPGESP
ncbi:hypothetical protein [Salinarchaeum sp. Harcht-Bsk1]|uniref:hypothetical protein n=1 Tax=Salinarchaeum sp. Harcht-Bsk1 TaxID=1333523 RepID=UPI0006777309|nr:hypothetical protein [Salinarchaeum sp. Harcht-Bsk1]